MKRPSMFDLTGQTMLVTGAASGIGLAISEALLEAGAAVVMADMNGEHLTQQAARLKDQFPKVSSVQIDVCDTPAVDRMVDDINTRFGAIDAVFANAGISAGRGLMLEAGRLENIDMDAWHKVLSVNLDGVLATMRAASRHMKARRQGRIIVTSSIAGMRAEALSGYAYVVSKAAVNNLVRQAAIELAPHNVLVNAIAPGPFTTEINGGRLRLPESIERMPNVIPLGRIAQPEEIKGIALLLASPASSYMTGAIIPVDGGASAR